MTKTPLHKAALVALVASGLTLSTLATAADDVAVGSDRNVERVDYSDLKLDDPKGMARLRTRIRIAARAVCGVDKAFTEAELAVALPCRRAAIDGAEQQISQLMASGAAVAASGSIMVAGR